MWDQTIRGGGEVSQALCLLIGPHNGVRHHKKKKIFQSRNSPSTLWNYPPSRVRIRSKNEEIKATCNREEHIHTCLPFFVHKKCNQSLICCALHWTEHRAYEFNFIFAKRVTCIVLILFHYSFLSVSFPRDWDRNCFALVVESNVERKCSPRVLATLSDFSTTTNQQCVSSQWAAALLLQPTGT